MAATPSITRRSLAAGAACMPAICAFPATARDRDEVEWKAISEQASAFHRDGLALVATARAEGLSAEAFSGMYKEVRNDRQLVLIFGDQRTGRFASVSNVGVWRSPDYA